MKIKFLPLILTLLLLLLAACNAEGTASPTAVPTLMPATDTPVSTETETIPTLVPASPTLVPASPTLVPVTNTPAETETNAANADVTFVRAKETNAGIWTFNVTVSHPDTGWDDYADGWDVVAPDGTVIKANAGDPFTRLLLHPHETEQPFTRSQSRLAISANVTQVTVRAHDLVDGFGGQVVVVDLSTPTGENFEVERIEP